MNVERQALMAVENLSRMLAGNPPLAQVNEVSPRGASAPH